MTNGRCLYCSRIKRGGTCPACGGTGKRDDNKEAYVKAIVEGNYGDHGHDDGECISADSDLPTPAA